MQIAYAHHNHGTSAAHHSKAAANAKAEHADFGTMLKTEMKLYDSNGKEVKPLRFKMDPELFAHAQQLAVELGLKKNQAFLSQEMQGRDFFEKLQELLDDGSISREDIINAVKYPPKITYNKGRDDKDGCSVELHFNGFEAKKPIEYDSASELLDIIWGKKKS